jgi:diguanylate cyclase (GGDEF)-like protein
MRRLLLPSFLLVAAVVLDRGWLGLSQPPGPALIHISRGVFVVAFLLAWRFRSGRVAAAVLALAATAEALRLQPPPGEALLPAVALLLPLNLALLGFVEEWRVASLGGLARFAALGVQGAAIAYVAGAAWAGEPLRAAWVGAFTDWRLPQPALAGFAVAALALASAFVLRGTPVEAGLLGALVASFVAFEVAATPLVSMAAGGVILALSQIERAFAFAFEDGLTGLPARRALEQRLRQLGRHYAIGMVDIDHFKRLNDRHGHAVGDQVLRLVASRLARVRGGGSAFRYGGEEFAVLFPGKSAEEAEPHLEALRRAIADHPFAVRGPARPAKKPKGRKPRPSGGVQRLKVTVSLGVAGRTDRRSHPEQVMRAADLALYRSKKAGRNRLTVG